MTPMPPSQPRDLQPLPLAIAACRRVWSQREDFLRLGIVPLLLTFSLNIWMEHRYRGVLDAVSRGETPDPATIDAFWFPSIVIGLASWFFTIVFAVNWMRLIALGNSAVSGLGLAISGRHVRLTAIVLAVQMALGIAIGLALVIVAMVLPVPAILFVIAVALMVAYAVTMLRLVPVWVGIAIDAPMSFAQSWKRTAGYGLRLLGAVILIACLVLATQIILTSLTATLGLLSAAPLAVLFVYLVIQFAMIACISTVFILAYPRFVSETV
jgi:hypothetical protein